MLPILAFAPSLPSLTTASSSISSSTFLRRSHIRVASPSTPRPASFPTPFEVRISPPNRSTVRAVASDDGSSLANAQPTLLDNVWKSYVRLSTVITNLFPVWTLIAALSALKKPALYTWLTTPYFTLSLGILMLSMGITLSIDDFKRVLRRFGAVTIGFVGCYLIMPLLALGLAKVFSLSPDLAAGLILIGAVNGGQASNLCTYIANGNVALSVMMTTSTTLGAIIMTPLISKLLIGAVVPVNALGIAWSTIQVVLFPIALGMTLNKYANKFVRAVLPFSPVLGVAATCLLVGSSVAQCATPIVQAGIALQIPILLLHVLGGIVGYLMVAFAGYGEIVRRTTAIETSMKSSAFGFLLASLHFGSYMVRVPAAVSVVWMALVGSTMAVIWRYIPVNAKIKFDRSLANRKSIFDRLFKKSSVDEPAQ